MVLTFGINPTRAYMRTIRGHYFFLTFEITDQVKIVSNAPGQTAPYKLRLFLFATVAFPATKVLEQSISTKE